MPEGSLLVFSVGDGTACANLARIATQLIGVPIALNGFGLGELLVSHLLVIFSLAPLVFAQRDRQREKPRGTFPQFGGLVHALLRPSLADINGNGVISVPIFKKDRS